MNNKGTVKISNFIIINIAGIAALDVEGVHEVIGFNPETFSNTKTSNEKNGIKMDIVDNKVHLDISLILKKGSLIPQVAKKTQEAIIDQVNTMTGLEVSEVNLSIVGMI